MIETGEQFDNKIVYITGSIDKPIITRILKIDVSDETKLSEIRRETYALERRGIQRKTGGIFHTHTATSFGGSEYEQGISIQGQRYNNQLGTERGRSGKTTRGVKEILFDKEQVGRYIPKSNMRTMVGRGIMMQYPLMNSTIFIQRYKKIIV